MAGEKITQILLAKSPLTPDEIAAMSDKEAWGWLYSHFPPKTHKKKDVQQICFTGFSPTDRAKLEHEAAEAKLHVVTKVTVGLRYLVLGPNAGPAKTEQAKRQGVIMISADEFHRMIETGEVPAQS